MAENPNAGGPPPADAGNGNPGGRPRGRRKALLAFLLVVVAVVATGALYWLHRQGHIETDDAFVDGNIHPVSARIQGTVVHVAVKDNQPVKKGDLLARIDAEPFAVREAGAESGLLGANADLAAARADVGTAEAEVRAAEQELAAARSQLAQSKVAVGAARSREAAARATLAQAERDAERARNLFARQSISRERHEKAQTALEVARSQHDLAREEMKLAEAAVPTAEAAAATREARIGQLRSVVRQKRARVGLQEANIRQRQATLSEARLQTGYTSVVSPADGYVTRKSVEVGQVVSPGQPLLSVASLSDVWVVANYKETQIAKIRPGQRVRIETDSYGGEEFDGRVDSIMAGTGSAFSLFPPENATGNYVKVVQRIPVKIVLDRDADPRHVLRIGMSVVPTVLVR